MTPYKRISIKRIMDDLLDHPMLQELSFERAINYAVENNVSVHLLGLVSDAGVHSLFSHLFALIDTCKLNGVNNLYIHGFSDGRDTSPKSGIEFFKRLQDKLDEVQIGKIATVCGRYYAMDRDKRWDRVELAYNALTTGEGKHFRSAERAIENEGGGQQ